jgi:hypothetical protein
VKTEATLLREIAAASTFKEQAALVTELDALRNDRARQVAASRDVDLANAVVEQTLQPVRVHEMHTASTDWLDEVATTSDPQVAHTAVMAEASLWFGRTSSFVKSDEDEFNEQAKGQARRVAGAYGEQAPEAEQAFLDYVAFLHRREAASGLDQIQQTVDPNNNPKTTPLPTETFDTFEEPVAPENQGVDEMQSSYNAPLLNEILQEGNGQGAPDVPGGHRWDAPSQPAGGGSGMNVGASLATEGSLVDYPSVAVNHVMDLDQFVAEQRAAKTAAAQPEPRPFVEARPAPGTRTVVARVTRTVANSGLPQIQQAVDVDGNPSPTPLPEEVAFPDEALPPRLVTNRDAPLDKSMEVGNTQVLPAYAQRKEADMFGGGDAPHAVPGQSVQDNASDYPVAPNGDFNAGRAAGAADAADPNARPTYADASSGVDPYVQGYVQGYSSQPLVQQRNDVPPSVSQDRTKGNDAGVTAGLVTEATMKRHAGIVSEATLQSKEFRKGYRFAARWKPGTRLVTTGSVEFESGLYAGMMDNDSLAAKQAWLADHEKWGEKDPQFTRRIALHRAFTAAKQAATSVDLDTMDGSSSPTVNTPFNGPGTVPPLAGGMDPAAPGGSAPYNGAPPYSSPVAPDPEWVDPSKQGQEPTLTSAPNLSLTPAMSAFRQQVQAGLLAVNKEES